MTTLATGQSHQQEIAAGERYAFGDNWKQFLRLLDEQRICEAMDSIRQMLEVDDLKGKTFLDIGSGSGLFSLAARRLGARVHSFDYDPQSAACTAELKRRYFQHDPDWQVELGSVLDPDYMASLGKFDIVYSWGVLHHTGDMWSALHNVDASVADKGKLFIALYNRQQSASKYWTFVKRSYNKYQITRPLWIFIHAIYPTLPRIPLHSIRHRKYPRGMNIWYDLYDWLGGYPFEVSTPDEIFEYYKGKGYFLRKLTTVGGRLGCNEFVFQRQ